MVTQAFPSTQVAEADGSEFAGSLVYKVNDAMLFLEL